MFDFQLERILENVQGVSSDLILESWNSCQRYRSQLLIFLGMAVRVKKGLQCDHIFISIDCNGSRVWGFDGYAMGICLEMKS